MSSTTDCRDQLRSRLLKEQRADLAAILDRCAAPFNLVCTACGAGRQVEQGCKKRWCPVCAPKITAARIQRFTSAAVRMQWPLAVTLTGPNVKNISGAVKRFRRALFAFRRSKFWRKELRPGVPKIPGGIVSFEITNTGKGWHVHCHLLIDCEWLALETRPPRPREPSTRKAQLCKAAHRELSRAWGKVLGLETAVVWVERAWGKALLETVKYNVKPTDLVKAKGRISDLIDEIHRMQLVNGFGNCYRMAKKWAEADKVARPGCTCGECAAVGSFIPERAIPRGRFMTDKDKRQARNKALAKVLTTSKGTV